MILQPVTSSGGSAARYRRKFNETPDGVRVAFTSPLNFRVDDGFDEEVRVNGQILERGVEDYAVSESGGIGTGYDTITFTFAPRTSDRLEIKLVPA